MLRGSCLCGAVRFQLDARPWFLNHCHCAMCRKVHGAAFGSFVHADGRAFRWLAGEDRVRCWESSPGNLRAFCTHCGSNMPVLEEDGTHAIIPAGTLDDDPGVRPLLHFHVASKAPWHEIADSAPQFATYPPESFWEEHGIGGG